MNKYQGREAESSHFHSGAGVVVDQYLFIRNKLADLYRLCVG